MLYDLADLRPNTLATMHGSSFTGDCAQALKDLNEVMGEIWGQEAEMVNAQDGLFGKSVIS